MYSKIIESKLPCDNCGSSDALAKYDDGHTYCFSCDNYTKGKYMTDADNLSNGVYGGLRDRKITKDTCKKYNVQVILKSGEVFKHIYPYYDKKGKRVSSKIRQLPKVFSTEGNHNNHVGLFGQNIFSEGGKAITIFEGELDALAAYQMTGSVFPCVSLPNGAKSAVAALKSNLEYLESFDKVVLCFDNDKYGKEAIEKVVPLFSVGKVRVMKLNYKDSCEYLLENKAGEFVKAWHNASIWTPEDVVCSSDMLDRIKAKKDVVSVPYPWEGLNEVTYGIRKGELVTFTAPTGIGKTQILREISYGLLNHNANVKIGTLFLEEQPEESALGLMSVHAKKLFHLPDTEYTEEERDTAFEEVLGNGNFYFYEKFGEPDIDKIINRIRYYVKGLDCEYIILDHLSIITSGQKGVDDRKALDEITTKLKTLTVELNVGIITVVHLNRQGEIRGSTGVEQLSNTVIHLERDNKNIDKDIRNTTTVTVWKNRFAGRTGVACFLKYDTNTGRMNEVSSPDEFED